MSDLVKRLRTHDDPRLYHDSDLVMSEAADHIEELERQKAILRDAISNLIKVKGRHNTEIAYQRLVSAFDASAVPQKEGE